MALGVMGGLLATVTAKMALRGRQACQEEPKCRQSSAKSCFGSPNTATRGSNEPSRERHKPVNAEHLKIDHLYFEMLDFGFGRGSKLCRIGAKTGFEAS